MKFCFSIDNDTIIEFEDVQIEPEIIIRTSDGLIIEIFGTKDELVEFANELYKTVNKQ